jgi:hypothetical protein
MRGWKINVMVGFNLPLLNKFFRGSLNNLLNSVFNGKFMVLQNSIGIIIQKLIS